MLKITLVPGADECAIRLEGRFVSAAAPLLEESCRDAEQRSLRLHFELAGLRHLDPASAHVIAARLRVGATTSGASPFVREMLEEAQ
ncbi:MAG: hypothetical protein JNM84_09285 [Planctomycetes bacterium]|nr:hypothetical protein [Planctomycetota bacterium]